MYGCLIRGEVTCYRLFILLHDAYMIPHRRCTLISLMQRGDPCRISIVTHLRSRLPGSEASD